MQILHTILFSTVKVAYLKWADHDKVKMQLSFKEKLSSM